jgi:hemolysin activation/secretion protein
LLRFEGLGEYRPMPKIAFSLGMRAQQASDPLMSFEEFSAGNYTIGRGYDPGTLLGDRGIGFQFELRVGSLAASKRDAVLFQPFAFLDFAKVWNEDRGNALDVRQDLSSVGGGFRARLGDKVQLEAALAVPLERAGLLTGKPDPRLLVSLTTRAWPWSY